MGFWQSITFENFIIQAGTDASLVPTDMATTNATVKFTYKNTGTFFGIHVAADPFTLSYSQLNLASGDVSKPLQSRSLPLGSGQQLNQISHLYMCSDLTLAPDGSCCSSRSSTRGGAAGGR